VKNLQYINKYFYRYRWRLFLGIVFVSASNYFRILQPQMIRKALDLVLENTKKIAAGTQADPAFYEALGKEIAYFGGVVLLLALMMGVFMYFMRQTLIVMSRLIEYDLRKDIFDHYQQLHLAFYRKNNTGDLMARITEDVSKVRNYLGPVILYGTNLVTLFTMTIYSMFKVNAELSCYALAPLPLLAYSIFKVSQQINKRTEVVQQQLATLNSTAQESFSGIRVIKSYVQEEAIVKHFATQADDYRKKSLHLAITNASFFPIMLLMIGASTIITVYIGGIQCVKGTVTPGNIAEFVIYINMLTWPVTSLGWIASLIQQAEASQKRINEFLNTKPEITNPTTDATPLKGHIEFKNVTFTYPDTGIKALENVSFDLQQGQKMALIGRTGSGKTSIADLLVRMYDVTSGEILIDGKNIQQHDLNNLRRQIGYVPQDVFLFSDNVSGNITFGKFEPIEQPIIEDFARYAAVHDDILTLSDGYKTMVGERGVTLSGGQKQRISIARAFIKQPNIMLLDDCLSAVDATTEQQILGYLNDSLAEKTAIIITHRIYGLLNFDKIIVLEDGKVAEMGTHDELLANKGYYFEMFEQQKMEAVAVAA
jgi:ATP-binding cassette, subfamily B, multidrug efflux pump